MKCDICLRSDRHNLQFLCPTDARNQLYEHRIQHAQALIEKDALDQQISALLTSRPDAGEQDDETGLSRPHIDRINTEREQAEDRTEQIIAHADKLRANIEEARAEIARRKATMARRRSERQKVANSLEPRRARQTEEVEKSIRIARYKWNQIHAVTASSRALLCGETAKLYGLRRARKNSGLGEYKIGGVGIVDLRGMNTLSPAQISSSLSHVVHLLMLSTHYLAIRLPAEITLPHRDYPQPTIFPLLSSYKYENVPFPGTTPAQPTDGTTAPSDGQPKQPRPRPLFVSKPLPIFAAEDAAGHALFLEGVTLLAYDIAWLCKSQGVPVGDSASVEDICNIGQNMFNLLIASQARGPSRAPSARTTPTKAGRAEGEEGDKDKSPGSLMGYYSHGSAHSFLGGNAGTEFTRGFKLLSPTKLADNLKAKLASEVANAEWELLDPDAWAIEEDPGDDGVVIGARMEGDSGGGHENGHENENGNGNGSGARRHGYGMQSFMSMRTVMDAVEVIGGGERRPGTSGWTKLKSR